MILHENDEICFIVNDPCKHDLLNQEQFQRCTIFGVISIGTKSKSTFKNVCLSFTKFFAPKILHNGNTKILCKVYKGIFWGNKTKKSSYFEKNKINHHI
jgi:hypothetical protein